MQYKTFPWNQWIDLLLKGDAVPFFEGLKRAVYMSAYFKGKKATEIGSEYGEEAQHEVLQTVALNLLNSDALRMFKKRAFSDGHIAAYIMKAIRNTISTLYTRRSRESATVSPLYETAIEKAGDEGETREIRQLADPRPSPEQELENRELSRLLNRIIAQLTARQLSIFQMYKNFCGEMGGKEIAVALKVSIQTVNKEVSRIKTVIRKAVLESGYSSSQKNWITSGQIMSSTTFPNRKGEHENVRAK